VFVVGGHFDQVRLLEIHCTVSEDIPKRIPIERNRSKRYTLPHSKGFFLSVPFTDGLIKSRSTSKHCLQAKNSGGIPANQVSIKGRRRRNLGDHPFRRKLFFHSGKDFDYDNSRKHHFAEAKKRQTVAIHNESMLLRLEMNAEFDYDVMKDLAFIGVYFAWFSCFIRSTRGAVTSESSREEDRAPTKTIDLVYISLRILIRKGRDDEF
jgi:hypothetical protein